MLKNFVIVKSTWTSDSNDCGSVLCGILNYIYSCCLFLFLNIGLVFVVLFLMRKSGVNCEKILEIKLYWSTIRRRHQDTHLPTLFSGQDSLPQYSHLQAVPSLNLPSVPPRQTTISSVVGSLKKQYMGVMINCVVDVGVVVVGTVVETGMVVIQWKSSP